MRAILVRKLAASLAVTVAALLVIIVSGPFESIGHHVAGKLDAIRNDSGLRDAKGIGTQVINLCEEHRLGQPGVEAAVNAASTTDQVYAALEPMGKNCAAHIDDMPMFLGFVAPLFFAAVSFSLFLYYLVGLVGNVRASKGGNQPL